MTLLIYIWAGVILYFVLTLMVGESNTYLENMYYLMASIMWPLTGLMLIIYYRVEIYNIYLKDLVEDKIAGATFIVPTVEAINETDSFGNTW